MYKILYAPVFVKTYSSFFEDTQEIILEKIEEFKNPKNHKKLKVHKLHGRLTGSYSFSVGYDIRIVFEYTTNKNEVILLAVGNHDIYKE